MKHIFVMAVLMTALAGCSNAPTSLSYEDFRNDINLSFAESDRCDSFVEMMRKADAGCTAARSAIEYSYAELKTNKALLQSVLADCSKRPKDARNADRLCGQAAAYNR